ncbi:CENPB DNA-binding domain-containing protein 1 [Portunus trituberculatus]|uniref:CENPB DNA-binding domain-containing protein 1 n=1 Tax=Portunus trituberculatus TaxID=210409 RepID=A0A5B7K6M8_PORTR|nr:CENPB DNA-binding domain-containing protein 1 [Portunus trituberculatus]
MPLKRPAMSPSIAKKTRKSLTLELKLDIIYRQERGEKTSSIAHHHGLTPPTVSTIFKSADSIKKAGDFTMDKNGEPSGNVVHTFCMWYSVYIPQVAG